MPSVAEIANYAAYDTLINNLLDDNIQPCSQQHKQNGHMIKKARYTK